MKNNKDTLLQFAKEEYCYLTTVGRKSGKPHEIEIWFGVYDSLIYLLSGGGDDSDWVKNLLVNPTVTVRVAKQTFTGVAVVVSDEKEAMMARHMLARKYQGWREGQVLSDWGKTALVIGIELGI